MPPNQHSFRVFIIFILINCAAVFGQYTFDDGPDTRCITPNRKPGNCVPLHQCQSIFQIFQMKAVDETLKKYLERALCRYEKKVPIVCCEADAGACITVERKPGVCIPMRRCEPFLNFMDKRPFLSEQTVRYFRQSECHFDNDPVSRICCPLLRTPLTGQIAGEITTVSPTALPTRAPIEASSVPTRTKPAPRVNLPIPGEEEGDCGNQEIVEKIIGGNVTDIYDYPWMALLKMGNGQFACGGSLIHERYVLTAAHCVTGPKAVSYGNVSSVRLGEWDILKDVDVVKRSGGFEDSSDDPVDIEAEEIIWHKSFSTNTLRDDIALIRLKKSAPYTEFIRPICLPTTKIEIPQNLTVAGWGRTEIAVSSNVKLHLTSFPYYDKEKCNKKYSNTNSVPKITLGPGQFCAGGVDRQDTCTGDSGGPIMTPVNIPGKKHLYFQLGIVSFGPSLCGLPDRPGVYTKVEEYMDWIYENMRP